VYGQADRSVVMRSLCAGIRKRCRMLTCDFSLTCMLGKNMHVDMQFFHVDMKCQSHQQVSFFTNLITICIDCSVSPHLMYHIFNLYRGLPFL
jgi:hypothetical protein